MSLTSHVGAVSSWHVLFGAELVSFATSSTVTAVKSASDDVTRRGTSHSGVAAVDARTDGFCSGSTMRMRAWSDISPPTRRLENISDHQIQCVTTRTTWLCDMLHESERLERVSIRRTALPSSRRSNWTLKSPHTIRYDTRCYFNVRSKADISQLNLPHGTDN